MSPTKKRQTMGKITRERELRERRAMKAEKKEGKKLAAAAESAPVDNDQPAHDAAEGVLPVGDAADAPVT